VEGRTELSYDNLPDDWCSYYGACGECGQRYHASGVVECGCVRCYQCEETKGPDSVVEITYLGKKGRSRTENVCCSCATCPECGREAEDEYGLSADCEKCHGYHCGDCSTCEHGEGDDE
jgi:hypothetical protein